MRRGLAWLVVVWVLALGAAGPAGAAVPEGPRLAFGLMTATGDKRHPLDLSLRTVPGSPIRGHGSMLLGAGRIQPLFGFSWSPDGSALAFSGVPRNSTGGKGAGIYAAPAEGGGAVPVPGTRKGTDPVISPDGMSLAFSRTQYVSTSKGSRGKKADAGDILEGHYYESTTAWIVDLATGGSRRLTGSHNGRYLAPTSFSPDGRVLLADRGDNVVKLDLAGGQMSTFARRAHSATYSPDGTRIALVSYRDGLVADGFDGPVPVGELYVVEVTTGKWRRLTRNRREEDAPSWDPSGERIAFTQATDTIMAENGFSDVVRQINADGSCPARIVRLRRSARISTLSDPAWRPGPGREAGRIVC